jgi:hypothetical protein
VAYLRATTAAQIARQLRDALTRDTRTLNRIVDGFERLGNRAEWTSEDERSYAQLHEQLAEICARYRSEASTGVMPPPGGGRAKRS